MMKLDMDNRMLKSQNNLLKSQVKSFANQLVCKLGNILGVSIKDEDVSISHRLPVGKSNTAVASHTETPAIIVKFVCCDV